jgi:hypothetical protein
MRSSVITTSKLRADSSCVASIPLAAVVTEYSFDKEPLTRDFFRRFDKALEAIKGDLEHYQSLSSTEAYTRSQLLLERLIFLYFLQNRGWLNQERHYLPAALDQHSDPGSFSYYHEFLDKLFWTLSTAPGGPGRLPGNQHQVRLIHRQHGLLPYGLRQLLLGDRVHAAGIDDVEYYPGPLRLGHQAVARGAGGLIDHCQAFPCQAVK